MSLVHEVFASKVQALCLSSSIQNSGYDKCTDFYQDNSYYIDVTDSNLESNPLMNFQNDFGFDNDVAEEKPPYILI